jgi:creatinine amidohydrolase
MPLFTDSLIATAVARAVEARLPDAVLLIPTLWLGASSHHLAFDGTLSASFAAYVGAIESVAESLSGHGFRKFYVVNGHGGNLELNGVALRGLKERHPQWVLGHSLYSAFIPDEVFAGLDGPIKSMRHACEAETSLGLHLFPELVRRELARDDGLAPSPPVQGVIHHFDEITEEGSFGFATLASAEKGRALFDAAVDGLVREIETIARGYSLLGLAP